jgi:hypothetical protein
MLTLDLPVPVAPTIVISGFITDDDDGIKARMNLNITVTMNV